MAIQYDKLNSAKAMLRTLRQEFLEGGLTVEELREQEAKIKADIRELLSLPPITPP